MKMTALVLLLLFYLHYDEALLCYECDGDVCIPNHCSEKENRCMTFRDVGGKPTGGCTTHEHCKLIKKKYENQSLCCETDFCNDRD